MCSFYALSLFFLFLYALVVHYARDCSCTHVVVIYWKSGNFGQCNIFGKWKKTPFSKKNFSVLRILWTIRCAYIRKYTRISLVVDHGGGHV